MQASQGRLRPGRRQGRQERPAGLGINPQLLIHGRGGRQTSHARAGIEMGQGPGVGGGQGAGLPLRKQFPRSRQGRNGAGVQLDHLARSQHLSEVTEQAKARDVRAGTATVRLQQLHQGSLVLLHRLQGGVDPLGLGEPGHRRRKQHPGANGPGQDQNLAVLQGALGPVALRGDRSIDAQAQTQAGAIASLQGVTTQQRHPEGIEHRAHAGQGLKEQLLLQGRGRLRQGDQGLHALQLGTTGPEVAAGMQGRQPRIQPGVIHQGRKAIEALQQQRPTGAGRQHRRILRRRTTGLRLQPGQGALQRIRGDLGGTAPAGHRLPARHGRAARKPLHEAPINALFPAPEQAGGSEGPGPVEGDGTGSPVTEQLQRSEVVLDGRGRPVYGLIRNTGQVLSESWLPMATGRCNSANLNGLVVSRQVGLSQVNGGWSPNAVVQRERWTNGSVEGIALSSYGGDNESVSYSGALSLSPKSCWGTIQETDQTGRTYNYSALIVNGRRSKGARGYLYLQRDPADLTVGWLVRD